MSNIISLIKSDEKDSKTLSKELLEQAIKGEITDVVILGYDKHGYEFYSSVEEDPAEIIWMLERTKLNLLRTVEE